jgi:hypothetical protein
MLMGSNLDSTLHIIKYNLDSTLHMQKEKYPRIYILSQSMDNLRQIVLPFMLPSMYYKLGINPDNRPFGQ